MISLSHWGEFEDPYEIPSKVFEKMLNAEESVTNRKLGAVAVTIPPPVSYWRKLDFGPELT